MIYVDPHRDQSGDRRTPGDDPEVVAAVHQAERAMTRLLVAYQIKQGRGFHGGATIDPALDAEDAARLSGGYGGRS